MCHKIKKTERQNQTHMKSNHILTNLGNYITTASGRQEEQEPKQWNAIDAAINSYRK